MLSFTRGDPIAAVCGGPYNGKIVHITEEEDEPDRDMTMEDIFEMLDPEDLLKAGKSRALCTIDQHKLRRAILEKREPDDEHLLQAYRKGKAKIDDKLKKCIYLEAGTMVMLPAQQSERIFIAGKSGSGKSCLAALYMNEYLRMYPESRIFLISRHQGERAYESVPHTVVPLEMFEEAEGERVFELDDLKNSLVVFDDCDNVQNKAMSDGVRQLNDDLISNGRKYNIYTLWLNHQLMEYSKTRNLLNEANKVIFFNSGSNYHIQQYLRRYVGLNAEQIKCILALKSRWTMVGLTLPMYILHEHGAFMLK